MNSIHIKLYTSMLVGYAAFTKGVGSYPSIAATADIWQCIVVELQTPQCVTTQRINWWSKSGYNLHLSPSANILAFQILTNILCVFGYIPGVRLISADVSESSLGSIF